MSWLSAHHSKQGGFTLGAASANSTHIEPEINLIPFIDVLLAVSYTHLTLPTIYSV